MLAAFEEWGVEGATKRFSGMFAFALWDSRTHHLTLARDAFGIKPLYYGRMGETLLFGSELKTLHAHPAFQPEIDRDSLALYVRFGYIPPPHSIYRGVRQLSPGSLLTLDS